MLKSRCIYSLGILDILEDIIWASIQVIISADSIIPPIIGISFDIIVLFVIVMHCHLSSSRWHAAWHAFALLQGKSFQTELQFSGVCDMMGDGAC